MAKEALGVREGSKHGQMDNGQRPPRPKMTAEERVARNRTLLQQYGSLIVVPRSLEGRILIQMVYPLNKAIPFLRRDLGVKRTVAEVSALLEPILQWVMRAEEWLRISGGELILMTPAVGESATERDRLVSNPRAHVIVPKTDEVRRVLEQAIRMDRVLVYLRMASLEQLREDSRLEEAFALVRTLDRAVQGVCAAVGAKYFSPKDMQVRQTPGVETPLSVEGRAAV